MRRTIQMGQMGAANFTRPMSIVEARHSIQSTKGGRPRMKPKKAYNW